MITHRQSRSLQEIAAESGVGPLLPQTFLAALSGLGGACLACVPLPVTKSPEPEIENDEWNEENEYAPQ